MFLKNDYCKKKYYPKLWADERFKGRKALLIELKERLQDF